MEAITFETQVMNTLKYLGDKIHESFEYGHRLERRIRDLESQIIEIVFKLETDKAERGQK